MQNKINLGADGIEIQLLDEMIDKTNNCYKSALETCDFEGTKNIPVYVIHAPIFSSFGLSDINIEDMIGYKNRYLFEQICFLANKYGVEQDHTVDIIFHTELSIDKLNTIGNIKQELTTLVGYVLFKYPKINICIENITPIRCKKVPIRLVDNFKFDNVNIVKYLRD